jgi:hypothetical protein
MGFDYFGSSVPGLRLAGVWAVAVAQSVWVYCSTSIRVCQAGDCAFLPMERDWQTNDSPVTLRKLY